MIAILVTGGVRAGAAAGRVHRHERTRVWSDFRFCVVQAFRPAGARRSCTCGRTWRSARHTN